ncbi:MAG: GNAT family N-acetyltransferase [Anaerolineae bacterium]|nr:GNAT family N-acetyltransferase [Anaerolineae bacterium]
MTELSIRLAAETDAAELARLNGLFNGATLTPRRTGRASARRGAHRAALLAWVDGRAVGFTCLRFARLITTALPYAEVTELFVEEAFRRRGIARALLTEAETLARALGAPGVILFTGLKNASAQAFYRAVGYHDYAITMRKVFGE